MYKAFKERGEMPTKMSDIGKMKKQNTLQFLNV